MYSYIGQLRRLAVAWFLLWNTFLVPEYISQVANHVVMLGDDRHYYR